MAKDSEKEHSGTGGLSLAPLTMEEALAALLEVKPDPPRKRRQKPSETPDAAKAKGD